MEDYQKMRERQKKIRNFSIIAHIDHGKSTLADRILELTNAVPMREMKSQLLDSMDLERERGITIKLNSVELRYKAKNNEEYIFHLIDTPGHVDFTYEVSRSLAACEGALLVVDATQGIEAQTLANVYLALDNDLEIIPVINKIDLPSARPAEVRKEISDVIGLDTDGAIDASAKEGIGVKEILEAIVEKIPAPKGDPELPLQALIFDSHYDTYRGVIPLLRVENGVIRRQDKIRLMATGGVYEVTDLGVYTPKEESRDFLGAGDVGWIAATIKNVEKVHVGDTITNNDKPAKNMLPGYRKLTPMVYSGVYPVDADDYLDLKDSLEKLILSDSSLIYEPESSEALGFGFRIGFLGLLHMEIFQERIEREYLQNVIITAPSVNYRVNLTDNTTIEIDNPAKMPAVQRIRSIDEPYVKATIIAPSDYVGNIMELCQNKRGIFKDMQYVSAIRVELIYEMPLSEIIFDFFNRLKSGTKGYASLDYELAGYRESKLVKVDILLNGEPIDALALIVHQDFAYPRSLRICQKLKEILPRQLFEIPIQAAIGSKVIARTNIKALRKDVLAKCYGGDVSRKKKLLEKQKEGKKRMKAVGSVEIPQEAFMAVLSLDDEK
ncbi:MAG TPA: translation elongation factor 4 [Bacillota bacterium]|nr:translation elongation factor 4 [Bacillota bacterium]HPF42445.1 translation elongation factor 4 [Bacillota bacterium]HPJ85703.1 translation elongation factor 4 [Bacillota bacterium]HPQ61660.1 translation elongation factor 4 [Bacillota bacterium]HRX91758.1 translation elongation factor 4 [Candidatus Izemoplasmatales bacterium]